MTNKILPEEIGINNYVNGTIKNYKKDKEPSPPASKFKHCSHYWVADLDADGRVYHPRILEWNPVNKKWYISGTIATTAEPVKFINGWFLISEVEVPEIPFEIKSAIFN